MKEKVPTTRREKKNAAPCVVLITAGTSGSTHTTQVPRNPLRYLSSSSSSFLLLPYRMTMFGWKIYNTHTGALAHPNPSKSSCPSVRPFLSLSSMRLRERARAILFLFFAVTRGPNFHERVGAHPFEVGSGVSPRSFWSAPKKVGGDTAAGAGQTRKLVRINGSSQKRERERRNGPLYFDTVNQQEKETTTFFPPYYNLGREQKITTPPRKKKSCRHEHDKTIQFS